MRISSLLPILIGLLVLTDWGLFARAEEPPPPPIPAAESDDKATFEEELESLRARLDEQSRQIERLTSSQSQQAGASDAEEELTLDRAGYAYDNGFVLQATPRDGNESAFRLRVNSWVQLRHTYFDSAGPNPDENNLEFERVRFLMSGHVFSKWLTYYSQIDADNDDSQTLSLMDYFISYDAGAAWFDWEPGAFGMRAGQWKLPFARARRISSQRVAFTERAMTTLFFDIERSLGASWYGEAEVGDRPVDWEFAVFNGFRTSGVETGRAGELDRNYATSGRVFSDVFGEWGEDSESDLPWHEQPAMRIGAGYALGHVEEEGGVEFSRQSTVDTGQDLADILPPGTDHYTMASFTLDANYKYRGWSFIADYYWRRLFDFGPTAVDDLFDHGFLLQAGYFVVPKKLELIARWDRIVGDSSSLGLARASADEIGFGAAYFINGHNLKIIFDASHVNGAVLDESGLNMLPGDEGWYYRTQFQLSF